MQAGTDRRVFLRVLGGTAGALAVSQLGCPFGATPARGPVDAGLSNKLEMGTLRALDQPVAIARDERGLYAVSTICAHKGCDIRDHGTISAQGIRCSCHGSEYDRNGAVTHGPAEHGLEHYRVELGKDGRVIVHAGEVVAADVRTPLE